MTFPSIVKGQYWDIAVFLASDPTTPVIICGLNSRSLTHQINTADEYIRDCQDPTSIPKRSLNPTGEQFDISGTGVYNRAQGSLIRSIIGKSLKYRFIMGEPDDDTIESGYYEGPFMLTNLQIAGPDGTNSTAQFTFASDGDVPWVDTADQPTLDPLTMLPATATHAVAYSGTISGKTTGSTITATSSDSTALTVTGTTVAGTFSAAGVKTITLTETLAGATNTPRVTKVTVTVA